MHILLLTWFCTKLFIFLALVKMHAPLWLPIQGRCYQELVQQSTFHSSHHQFHCGQEQLSFFFGGGGQKHEFRIRNKSLLISGMYYGKMRPASCRWLKPRESSARKACLWVLTVLLFHSFFMVWLVLTDDSSVYEYTVFLSSSLNFLMRMWYLRPQDSRPFFHA